MNVIMLNGKGRVWYYQVFTWLLCEHTVKERKVWAFIGNFVSLLDPNSAEILSQLSVMARPTWHAFQVFKNKFDKEIFYKGNVS